jgi:S-adenosylmethionine decarboxylase proenzyme
MMGMTGMQLLLDLYDCDAATLHDAETVESIFRQAINSAGFQVVNRTMHQFPHQGITLVLILAQSHATLHTWPESNFATVDVYACGASETVKPALEKICEHLVQRFAPLKFSSQFVNRGLDSNLA